MSAGLGAAGRIAQRFIASRLTPLLALSAVAMGAFSIMMCPPCCLIAAVTASRSSTAIVHFVIRGSAPRVSTSIR